jgi:hypothetical protein
MRYRYEEQSPQNKRQYVIAVGVHELRALLGAVQVALKNAPDITEEERERLQALRTTKRGLSEAIKVAEANQDDGKRRKPYAGEGEQAKREAK